MLAACAIVHRLYPEVHFVLCGEGVSEDNQALMSKINYFELESVCHLLGRRDDMLRLTSAFDIACLSSVEGEGFPNVIGEAMACAVPCVVTDVGDSAAILDGLGVVVVPGSPDELARGLTEMIKIGSDERRSRGNAARQRIERFYTLPYIVNQYENLYRDFL
jgi:glycosyltransferase involved in cell wall biosynthesis